MEKVKPAKLPKEVEIKGVTWSVPLIKERMKTDNKVLVFAMLRIFSFQTESEKVDEETSASNGMGFNALDAEFLSKFCKQFIEKKFLSEKQLAIMRKKMPKYASQLYRHINNRGLETAKNLNII